MVTEATNALLAGIIAGWLVAFTQPIITLLVDYFHKKSGMSKVAIYLILNIIWLIAMIAFVVKIYG